MKRRYSWGMACLAAVLVAWTAVGAQDGARNGEWRYYSGDDGNTKYAPLDQIDATNVHRLKIAWRRPAFNPDWKFERPSNSFQTSPLMIGGVLYAANGVGLLEAFDPGTGRTIWTQEPPEGFERPLTGTAGRGIAHWREGADERIFAVRGTDLSGVDARTGRPAAGFGRNGIVSLARPEGADRYYFLSPPVVLGDIVIVGSGSTDNAMKKEGTPGDVNAYDVRSGRLRWTFHVIPRPGEFGAESWKNNSNEYSGGANVWPPFTADQETGYVYLPTSTPMGDWYGGHRPGQNLFAESIVCLDGRTGKRVWHFQTVHHGLWDYDNPAAPILGDITVNGRRIKAVIQLTKQGFVFTFDRLTGEPVWPIEERPVPASKTPGEEISPTQPFPTKPPPYERQGVSLDDLIDFTPELRAEAVEFVKQYTIGPLFTPPTIATETNNGTLGLPGWAGGANWGGAAFDPETGVLYIPSVTDPFNFNLVKPDPARGNMAWVRSGTDRPSKHETRWGNVVGPSGLPLVKPPYGRITAIDMNRGEHVWMVPNGDGPRNHERLKHLNLPPLGQGGRVGPVLTKTLLFVGDGDAVLVATPPFGGGTKFRALDKQTGKVAWETEFPAGVTGAPITYMHRGKQYIVVAIGGQSHPAEFVALALDGPAAVSPQ